MKNTPEIDFSKIEWWITKSKQELLDNLIIFTKTKWEQSELAKKYFWVDLEKLNLLARIDEISEKINPKIFKELCFEELNLA